jgi:hypothetical protein
MLGIKLYRRWSEQPDDALAVAMTSRPRQRNPRGRPAFIGCPVKTFKLAAAPGRRRRACSALGKTTKRHSAVVTLADKAPLDQPFSGQP